MLSVGYYWCFPWVFPPCFLISRPTRKTHDGGGRVKVGVVDAHDVRGDVVALGRRGDQHALGASLRLIAINVSEVGGERSRAQPLFSTSADTRKT